MTSKFQIHPEHCNEQSMSDIDIAKSGAGLADRDGLIWRDGELLPWREATTHFLTHTLHYGLGVFEGVRSYATPMGSCIFRLAEHTQRLLNSARIVDMSTPFDAATLNEAQKNVLRVNKLNEAYIRPMLFYNSEEMGLRTDTLSTRAMIAAWEWPSYMEPEAQIKGIRVKTSRVYTRHHAASEICQAKISGFYFNSILALREAKEAGCDEAMMLDNHGCISEGSGENVFLVKAGVLRTPEPTSCLKGITRDSIMTLAREAGVEVREERLKPEDVYAADEAFFTGTAAEVVPICEMDQHQIGDGRRGPLTEKLQSLYHNETRGKNNFHPEWLTPIKS